MTMSTSQNIEFRRCVETFSQSIAEQSSDLWLRSQAKLPPVIICEGFEERSLGLLRRLAKCGLTVPSLALVRYADFDTLNATYCVEFEELAERVSEGRWKVVLNKSDDRWAIECLEMAQNESVLFDISGMTSRGVYGALDLMRNEGRSVVIGYSEAMEYRPTRIEWEALLAETRDDPASDSLLAEKVDEAAWLYSGAHTVQLFRNHEGYDAAGIKALVAFLPFKPVRIASLLGEQQYSAFRYVVGRPRLASNSWRLDALRRINAAVINQSTIVEMNTFGYKETFRSLSELVCGDQGLLGEFDVHLAPMGSKLQNLACWLLSTIVPAVTLITSIPNTWHAEAFSDGVGESWVFPLTMP